MRFAEFSKVSIRSAAVFQQSEVQGNTKGISADLPHEGGGGVATRAASKAKESAHLLETS